LTDSDIPAEVKRLIQDALSSMDHVEVLFRLHRDQVATPEHIAADAHIDAAIVMRVLRDLADAGIVVETDGQYRVTDAARDRSAVEALVEMYNTRPVTLIRAVYARVSPVKTFADAFRIRRND